MITQDFENDLYRYVTGIIQNHGHKMIAINGLQDHVHVLAGIRPKESISDICEYVKASSSKWINDNHLTQERFQ
jgi:putative transposase